MSGRARPLVLVADDDGDILHLVKYSLEAGGCDVLGALDGEEALRVALERSPDLAVIDARMPKLDGHELTRRIRESEATATTRVLLFSASVRGQSVALGFASGADDFLEKPFSPDDLVARALALLDRP